jgi:hypothetical protein
LPVPEQQYIVNEESSKSHGILTIQIRYIKIKRIFGKSMKGLRKELVLKRMEPKGERFQNDILFFPSLRSG